MIRCPKCGTESPDRARFCRSCGEPLPQAAAGGPGAARPAAPTPEERARRLLEEAFRLSEEGKLLAAIQVCQQAVAINPGSTSAHSLLGTLYERQGDRDNAIREYEQVLTLSPGSTVERRRLNELMGVPAAREAAAAVSPRVARLAVAGGALVAALVLVAAILVTVQQGPQPARQVAAGGPAGPAATEAAVAQPSEVVPSPGSVYYSPSRMMAPRAAPPRPAPQQPERAAAGYGGAQWVAPGTYMLPSYGAQRAAGPAGPAPPIAGAVPMAGSAQPTVSTPAWRTSAGTPIAARLTPEVGRGYYFQGDYRSAIDAYQTYLATNAAAGPRAREELAWVYTEAGDRGKATQEYRQALGEYQSDLARGHNTEAARHGVRTCRSALRVLESR